MNDTIIKGTGNSRTLKTTADLPATYDEFRAKFIAGTLPVDIGALVAAGVQQQGMTLTKANLLSDATASALGLTGNPTPNDALAKLKALLSSTDTTVAGKGNCEIYTGSYVGDGANSKTLTFPKPVSFISIYPDVDNAIVYIVSPLIAGKSIHVNDAPGVTYGVVKITTQNSSVVISKYNDYWRLNTLNSTYKYIALAVK